MTTRAGRPQAPPAGLAALAAGLPLGALLVPAMRPDVSSGIVLVLVLVGLSVLACAGGVPLLAVPSLHRAQGLFSGLVVSAAVGAAAVLVAITLPVEALEAGDPRLEPLVPYTAAAAAVLGLAYVLAYQRLVCGADRSVAALTAVSALVVCAELAAGAGLTPDDAVVAALDGGLVLFTGLAVTTLVATPIRRAQAPAVEAEDVPAPAAGLLVGAVVVGILLRLATPRPLWLDDAALARLTESGLGSTLDAARSAAHPPLQAIFTWFSRQTFGSGLLGLRLPSLLAWALLVPAVYLVAVRLYGRRTAVVAAAVAAVGPSFVWISTDTGPGALSALLAAVTLLMLVRSVEDDRPADWVGLGLAGAALLWTHQLAIAHLVVVYGAAAALLRRRQTAGGGRPLAGLATAVAITAVAGVALLSWRDGIGGPAVLAPLEYATDSAPAGGHTPFGLAAAGLSTVVGFHPPGVSSRLLALWPLAILAVFALLGRRWSSRGLLLMATAAAPFAALLLFHVAGASRQPPFALGWLATAFPAVAVGIGRAVSLAGGGARPARFVAGAAAGILLLGVVDQSVHVRPDSRFDLDPIAAALDETGPGDLVVYSPASLADFVAAEAPGVQAVAADAFQAGQPDTVGRVAVVAAFGLDPRPGNTDQTLAAVEALAARRPLQAEHGTPEVKAWLFS